MTIDWRAAYRIKLPAGCHLHDVIHVSKLWKYHASPDFHVHKEMCVNNVRLKFDEQVLEDTL